MDREVADTTSSSITLIPRTSPFTALHHSLTGDISCDPTLFPLLLELRCTRASLQRKTWANVKPSFWLLVMLLLDGWLNVSINHGEQNIPLCNQEVNLNVRLL